MRRTIALIGAGQMGSRHLQSFALLDKTFAVHVVEPSLQAVSQSQARWLEVAVPESPSVQFHRGIGTLPSRVDVCFIATNSVVREQVLRQVLADKKVRAFVLEKVLFASVDSYERVAQTLLRHDVPAWVNCPNRLWPLYQSVKNHIPREDPIEIRVQGKEWGLATSAIHYLDLGCFLTGAMGWSVHAEGLQFPPARSRRPGFSEFYGMLEAVSGKHAITLICEPGTECQYTVSVRTNSLNCQINEAQGTVVFSGLSGNTTSRFQPLLQSRLSHKIVQDIVSKGRCSLPSYDESMRLHLSLLGALSNMLISKGSSLESALIT